MQRMITRVPCIVSYGGRIGFQTRFALLIAHYARPSFGTRVEEQLGVNIKHRTWEVRTEMADDRMRNDDRDMNMGGAGQKNQGSQNKQGNFGQQTPGHSQQDDEFSKGQRGAGQRSEPGHMEDDFGSGEQGLGQGGKKDRQNY
jgi:hypothetical protein